MSMDLQVPTEELVPDDPFQVPQDPDVTPREVKKLIAFNLRRAGASYQLIADKLGYARPGSVEKLVKEVLEEHYTPEALETVMGLELARLDDLMLVAYRRAREGDLNAIDRILKIMERRSRYLGLDQPEPVSEVTHNTAIFISGDKSEYIDQLRQAREFAAEQRQLQMVDDG